MSAENRKAFRACLRDEFAPELRKIGFKGSGSHFRRLNGEIINAIWIQGDKYGRGCAVNLGLHLTFLPMCWTEALPDPATIKEIDCEFRTRLAPKSKSDHWWKYGGLLKPPEKSARHLIQTYFHRGEPLFAAYPSVEVIGGMFLPADLEREDHLRAFGDVTVPRIALVLARIQRHLGNQAMAEAYASVGLRRLGRAVALKPLLEALLDSN